MFDADRPITKSSQDRLNRDLFSKYLARCLLDHTEPDSLVIGLYGGWGVGKTSVINLIKEELELASNNMEDYEKPIVLNFSPWSYSGQNQLLYNFFRRLSATLRAAEFLDNKERIVQLLELYVSFFTNKPMPKSFIKKTSTWEKVTRQSNKDSLAWESGRDLTLVKAELNALLSDQHHKIIIIIDNISRLYPEEIKQIFQIIKSIGDYANTTYLLALDKEQVVHSLDKLDGSGGAEFIEKVIQLSFDIPPICQQNLENILSDRLSDVLQYVPEDTWNVEYWADVYYGCLKYLFGSVRDITRYVNTLKFSYPRLRDVVNPVDFFALTAIEVFLPQIYSGIQENKDLFTDLLDHVYVNNADQVQKDKLRCDEILARNKRIEPQLLLNLLMLLFPSLRMIYQPDIKFHYSEAAARKYRRICSVDLFDIYFRLSMQVNTLSNLEFETIISIASDSTAFDQALVRLNQDGRIMNFLDLLDGRMLEKIPQHNIQAIVSALLDNGDLFPQVAVNLLSLETPMRVHRIIHHLLRRFDTYDDRFTILQNAINSATKSLYVLVQELREQEFEHKENADEFLPEEFRDLKTPQIDSLHKSVVKQIQCWAKDERLIEHPRLLAILNAWLEWGNTEDVRSYIKEITNADRGLLAFLTAALEKPINDAISAYRKNSSWETSMENINRFIPATQLEQHAKALFEDPYFEKLREREQLALMIFLDLIKAPTKKVIPKTSV